MRVFDHAPWMEALTRIGQRLWGGAATSRREEKEVASTTPVPARRARKSRVAAATRRAHLAEIGPDMAVSRFLARCTRPCRGARLGTTALFDLYEAWAQAEGELAMTNKELSRALEARGFRKHKSNTMWWCDLQVAPTPGQTRIGASDPPNLPESEQSSRRQALGISGNGRLREDREDSGV